MNARLPLLPLLCVLGFTVTLAGCFGSSSGSSLPLAVEFTTPPPISDTLGNNFQVAAAVSDGSKVNWSCTPTGACGSFSPAQTGSNVATTYMPPPTVPAGGSVTIMAISNEDMTKEASANVTINAGGAISVTFIAPAPPPSLTTSAAAQLTATITSTVTNAVSDGVDWTTTCTNSAGGGCGKFTLAHTNSGVSTTYDPPTTVPAAGVAVTVTAASHLDPANSVSGVIVVSTTQTSAFLCAGCSYTYTVSGEDANGPYSLAGVFTTDGMGDITGGEQDFSDFAFSTGNTPDQIVVGINSGYSFGSDGRGVVTIDTGNINIGVSGVETLGVVFVSPSHLLITELDASATASGTIDKQTLTSFSQSTLSGGYAFVATGANLETAAVAAEPLGFGGVFDVSSPGVISSSSGTCDANLGGFTSTKQGYTSGSGYGVPDGSGRVQITLRPDFIGNLNSQFGLDVTGPVILDAYITDAAHLKFVEVDSNFGVTAGLAIGQGAATGTLTSAATLLPDNSSFVFTAFGQGVTGPLALAATVTSDGSSKLQNSTGGANADANLAGVPSSGTVTGSFSVDSSGTGRVGITLNGNVGVPGNTALYAAYFTGGADPPMLLELDDNGVTAGNLFAQATGPFSLSSFQGSYGLNFTLFNPSGSIEVDVSGQAFADGAGNLLGTLDINDFGVPQANQSLAGLYASAASGRFTGSLTTPATSTLGVSFYVVSSSEVVMIETDTQAVSLGLFQLQSPPF